MCSYPIHVWVTCLRTTLYSFQKKFWSVWYCKPWPPNFVHHLYLKFVACNIFLEKREHLIWKCHLFLWISECLIFENLDDCYWYQVCLLLPFPYEIDCFEWLTQGLFKRKGRYSVTCAHTRTVGCCHDPLSHCAPHWSRRSNCGWVHWLSTRLPGFNSCLHYLLSEWPWVSWLISLCLSFLIYKNECIS